MSFELKRPVAGLALVSASMAILGCNNVVGALALGPYPNLVPLSFLPQETYQVVASLDGAQIAYTDATGLFVADLAAMTTKKLAGSDGPITSFAFSGDGRSVLFLPTVLPVINEPGEPKRESGPIYPAGVFQRVDVESGAISETTMSADSFYGMSASPDGRYMAVWKQAGVFLYDLARNQESRLSAGPSWPKVTWSPDSRRLAAIEMDVERHGTVVITSIEDGRVQRIDEAGLHMDRMGAELSCSPEEEKLSWNDAGDRLQIVQNRDRQHVGITTFSLDGQQLDDRTVSVADPNPRRYVDCYHPSPDGRYVVALKISGDGGIPEPSTSLVGIETSTGRVRDVAPPSGFVAWLGHTSRFVLAYSDGRYSRYFIADVAGR